MQYYVLTFQNIDILVYIKKFQHLLYVSFLNMSMVGLIFQSRRMWEWVYKKE